MISDLAPILSPVWVPLSPGVEVTAWPLRLTDGSFLFGASGEVAEAYAHSLGGELTSAEEEDQIIQAAAMVLRPISHWPKWPRPAEQSTFVMAKIAELGGCDEDQILAGACKVWTRDRQTHHGGAVPTGMICNYGWPVPLKECRWGEFDGQPALLWQGTPTYTPYSVIPFRMLQGLACKHNRFHKDDYSQGVRVRREAKAE